MGSRVIDIISSDGKFVLNDAFIKSAHRQPVFYQLQNIKNCIKTSFIDIYKTADLRQTRETCPFNIYGRIAYKAKKGSAYYYSLLSYKNNKTLPWDKSGISLERDWEKANSDITIEIKQYENMIKSVLRMKNHNYLKQFRVKLFRNNIYFKNVTSKLSD